ncbi:MAG: type II/IV secretion system ATPase subunit, partial [Methanosarcinales archaeon]
MNEIEPLMNDPYIEDISCDGTNVPLYIVHRKYGSLKTNIIYSDEKKLQEFIVKLAERCGRFISYAEPLLDGSLPDGSRIQASFSKDVTTKGPTFTIRKFVEEPLSPIDLIKNKTVNSEVLAYLWLAVESGSSILIGGGAATGKTTFLNALSMFIPPTAKIVSIEDTRELNLMHENWIPSVARVGFAKGIGEVTMFDLLKESFRQSPDYVIVGEVRGKEAYVMFQGMAAGFPALGTMHAGKVDDIIYRLETPP